MLVTVHKICKNFKILSLERGDIAQFTLVGLTQVVKYRPRPFFCNSKSLFTGNSFFKKKNRKILFNKKELFKIYSSKKRYDNNELLLQKLFQICQKFQSNFKKKLEPFLVFVSNKNSKSAMVTWLLNSSTSSPHLHPTHSVKRAVFFFCITKLMHRPLFKLVS